MNISIIIPPIYLSNIEMKSNSNHYKLRSLIRENIISMDKDFQSLMLEREFNQIFDGLYSLLKENGKWTSPNTYEWDPEIKKMSSLERIEISVLRNQRHTAKRPSMHPQPPTKPPS